MTSTERPAPDTRVIVTGGPDRWHGQSGTVRAWTPGPLSLCVELDGGAVVFLTPAQVTAA
jgi:hypothetical protein